MTLTRLNDCENGTPAERPADTIIFPNWNDERKAEKIRAALAKYLGIPRILIGDDNVDETE